MNRKNGFTLIELLVVVSIIGFLASTIVASLNSARKKAEDVQRIQVATEYRNAIALYYSENESYPSPTVFTGANQPYCLGQYADGFCGDSYPPANPQGDMPQDSQINNALSPYIKLPKGIPFALDYYGVPATFEGPVYVCRTSSAGRCTTAAIFWVIEPDQKCPGGATQALWALSADFESITALSCAFIFD